MPEQLSFLTDQASCLNSLTDIRRVGTAHPTKIAIEQLVQDVN
jgi:hypothetical protein